MLACDQLYKYAVHVRLPVSESWKFSKFYYWRLQQQKPRDLHTGRRQTSTGCLLTLTWDTHTHTHTHTHTVASIRLHTYTK